MEMNITDQDAEVIKHLREQLQEAQKRVEDLSVLLRLGYEVYQQLVPGIKHIAVADYAAVNTFGVKCEELFGFKNEKGQDSGEDTGAGAVIDGSECSDDSDQSPA